MHQGTGVLQSLHSLAWISLHFKKTLLAQAAYHIYSAHPLPRSADQRWVITLFTPKSSAA